MGPGAGPSAISGGRLEPRERLVGIAHPPGPAAIEGVGADEDAGVECASVLEKGRTFVANADEELAGHGGLRGRAGKGATDDRPRPSAGPMAWSVARAIREQIGRA